MPPTPAQFAEAERRVEADIGPSTWGRNCLPLRPCESGACGRQACRGLARARDTLQKRQSRRYAARRRNQ